MPLPLGTLLGPYEVTASIGAGGMGEVYKARDRRLDRVVALKTVNEEFSERFGREARAIAALNHAHICQIYDVGPNYLVMEFVEGSPLQGPLPPDQVLRYAIQICDALNAAHSRGIIHCDLKPENILLTSAGVKLLDFGLARFQPLAPASKPQNGMPGDATETLALTCGEAVAGTASYMSPEQAQGRPLDHRSDIFSFGAVLYELASGNKAFSGSSLLEILSAVIRDQPRPLTVSPDLAQIVSRCLCKAPADRYPNIAAVKAALEACSAHPSRESPAREPSIAVLPFVNMSADQENEYFSDGLAEEILNLLAKIPGLKVIARTSSFAFRGKEQDITKIAEALRAQNILEGSVRTAGNRIRVTAQLIDASDGTHRWSERYDRELNDVFAIQDEIGRAISEALKLQLAPHVQTVNIEAWQHCLKGEYYRVKYTPEALAKAKAHFEQAIAIDPNYAYAHGLLAAYYYSVAFLDMKRLREMALLVKASAEKSLALDPGSIQSHSLLAVLAAVVDHNWNAAAGHHARALAENISPGGRHGYSVYYLLPLGRTADAIEQSRLALENDPLSMIRHMGLAYALNFGKRYNESMEASRRALEIDPNSYLIWHALGMAQFFAAQNEDAIHSLKRAVELAPWFASAVGMLASAYHRAGDQEHGREWVERLAQSDPDSLAMAEYYATTGETEAMFQALERAYQKRDVFMIYMRVWPSFDPYRPDARFQSILQRLNLAPDPS